MTHLIELLIGGIVFPFIFELLKQNVEKNRQPINFKKLILASYTGVPLGALVVIIFGGLMGTDTLTNSYMEEFYWHYIVVCSIICFFWYLNFPYPLEDKVPEPKSIFGIIAYGGAGYFCLFLGYGMTVFWLHSIGFIFSFQGLDKDLPVLETIFIIVSLISLMVFNCFIWYRVLRNISK